MTYEVYIVCNECGEKEELHNVSVNYLTITTDNDEIIDLGYEWEGKDLCHSCHERYMEGVARDSAIDDKYRRHVQNQIDR